MKKSWILAVMACLRLGWLGGGKKSASTRKKSRRRLRRLHRL